MMHSQRYIRNLSAIPGFLYLLVLLYLYYFQCFISFLKRLLGYGENVKGKIVVVTGAAQGIGLCTAELFARQGCAVVLLDIKPEVEKIAKDLTAQNLLASAYVLDVSDYSAVKDCFSKIINRLGRIDVVVCNAGILYGKLLSELDETEIRKTYEVNVLGVMWTVKACLDHMVQRNKGHIVATVSMSAMTGVAYLCDYASSKFAVNGFMESLADELRLNKSTRGISVSMVFPAFAKTELVTRAPVVPRARFESDYVSPELIAEKILSAVRFRRFKVFVPEQGLVTYLVKNLLPWKAQRAVQDFFGFYFESNKHA